MGALPRVRIQQAEAKLEDAKDEVVLAHDLYGDLPEKGASEEASAEMIAAAQRRVDRQQARLDDARKMVDAGVAARILSGAIRSGVDGPSNQSRSGSPARPSHGGPRSQESMPPAFRQPIVPAPPDDSDCSLEGMEHYEGDGAFNELRDLPPLEFAFATQVRPPASDQRGRRDRGASRTGVRSSRTRGRGRCSQRSGRRLAAAVSSIAEDSLLRFFARYSGQGHRRPHPHWSGKHTPGQSAPL